MYDIAYNYIVDNGYVEQMFNAIKETATTDIQDTANALNSKVNLVISNLSKNIEVKISSVIDTAGTKLSDFKKSCVEKLKTAANQGAEKLKEELTNQI